MGVKHDEKLKERYELIKDFYIKHSRMPSYSEMALLFGVRSKNAVFKIINRMMELNLIKRDEKGYIHFSSNPFSIKLLGQVEAGFPSPADEELLDTISLDRFLVEHPESTFMLKVSGDSMIEAGILPGDYVMVDRSRKPKENDIVVAQVDGQWTMKYLSKEGKNYILKPANRKYKPIRPKNELIVAGVVIGVVRKYR